MCRFISAFIQFLIGSVVLAGPVLSQDLPREPLKDRVAEKYEWMLQSEEVRSRIIAVGEEGIPRLCGTQTEDLRSSSADQTGRQVLQETEHIGWELVPGVVPADGSESFHVKVETNQDSIEQIFLKLGQESFSAIVAPEGEPRDQVLLRDDGEGNDEVAGDSVYTSRSLGVDTTGALMRGAYQEFRSEGLFKEDIQEVVVEKTGGSKTMSVIRPQLLIMETGVHDPGPINALDSIQVSGHFVNLKGGFGIQKDLRNLDLYVKREFARRVYDHVKDKYEFIVFMSSNHVEIVPNPENNSRNYWSGYHLPVQVDYEGTGQETFDNSDSYGSSGELLGISILDVFGRGLEANNITHEILHQWSAFIPDALGLTSGAHYDPESSVKSLLGGVKWTENEGGTFRANCKLGSRGAYSASQLDLYMMGLVPGSEMDTLWAASDGSFPDYCTIGFGGGDDVLPSEIQDTVSIESIQEAVGEPREPDPESAQRDYEILFVVESNGRLLTDLEMAFYDLLAQHYTSSTAEGGFMGGLNWNPIQPYFGHETTWRSEVEALPPLPVELPSFDATASGGTVHLSWQTASEQNNAGFDVQRKSPDGSSWTQVGFVEGAGSTSKPRSYRFTDENLPYEADRLTYRLRQVDTDGSASYSKEVTVEREVKEAQLLGTYPTPATQSATVRYALPERQDVKIYLYDVLGRRVQTVVEGEQEGRHKRQLDVSRLASGVYFLRLQSEGQTRTQKLTVVR